MSRRGKLIGKPFARGRGERKSHYIQSGNLMFQKIHQRAGEICPSSEVEPKPKSVVVKVRSCPTPQSKPRRRSPSNQRDREHNQRNYWHQRGPFGVHPDDRYPRSPELPHSRFRHPYSRSFKTRAREFYTRRQQERGAKLLAQPPREREGKARGSPPNHTLPPEAVKILQRGPPIHAPFPEMGTGQLDTNQALRVIIEAAITAALRSTATPAASSSSGGVSPKASS